MIIILVLTVFTVVKISNDSKKTSIEVQNQLSKELYRLNKYQILDLASFTYDIELTNTQKYGKAYFFNESPEPITMYVDGNRVEESIVIPKNSGRAITWTKGGIGNKTYKVTINSNGNATLNGYFSLLNSNMPFND